MIAKRKNLLYGVVIPLQFLKECIQLCFSPNVEAPFQQKSNEWQVQLREVKMEHVLFLEDEQLRRTCSAWNADLASVTLA